LRGGQQTKAVALFAEHPELQTDRHARIALAYEEYCQRKEAGETVDVAAFCARYPDVQSRLIALIDLHSFAYNPAYGMLDGLGAVWPQVGTPFLGFLLLQELGQGAFARVYLARDLELGQRLVVVKLSVLGGDEAQTLGPLSHPNIVPVYSVAYDPEANLTAICMPYLGSATLHDLIAREAGSTKSEVRSTKEEDTEASPAFFRTSHFALRTSAHAVLRVARQKTVAGTPLDAIAPDPVLDRLTRVEAMVHLVAQLADALAFVHGQDIYHRDLKPSNVLLGPDGRPRLLDFNLAARADSADDLFGGTVTYMAPEQLRLVMGQETSTKDLGARTDLFSLGVILYELLTGQYPFGPADVEMKAEELAPLLLERQRLGPPPLAQACPQADRALQRIVRSCLEFDPRQRPASAAELAKDLRRTLARSRLRRRLARGLVAGMGMVLLIASALAILPARPAPQGPYEQGLQAYQEKKYATARDFFHQLVSTHPEEVQARFARARAQQQLNDYNSALVDYIDVDRQVKDCRVKACIGYACSRVGDHPRAMHYDRWAIQGEGEIVPKYDPAPVWNNLGYSAMHFRNLDLAEKYLAHALELDPRLQAAYHNRARLHYSKAGNIKYRHKALAAARTLGFLFDLQGPGLCSAAALAEASSSSALAIRDIEDALELGPCTAELFHDAACCWTLLSPVDQRGKTHAMDYVWHAMKQGAIPLQLYQDPALSALAQEPRFQQLQNMHAPPPPPAAVRLREPREGHPQQRP
jgi:serine/threonine protein kinase